MYAQVSTGKGTDNNITALAEMNKKLDSINKTLTGGVNLSKTPIIDPIYLVAIIGSVMVIPVVIETNLTWYSCMLFQITHSTFCT